MQKLSQSTEKLVQKYQSLQNQHRKIDDTDSTIHVDEIAKRVASFYDKIRGIIDWKGEHLLRRSAIERTLRRRTLPKVNLLKEENQTIDAESLVIELIRAGHLPNDKIKESKVGEVQETLDKYSHILNNLPNNDNDYSIDTYQWITSVAACEIEEILIPSKEEKFLLNYFFEEVKEIIEIEEGYFADVDEKTKETLLYIASQRALFGLDEPIIAYHIFKFNYHNWNKLPKEDLESITRNIYKIREKLDFYFNHKLEKKLYNLLKKQRTPYILLGDILKENRKDIDEMIVNPEKLETALREIYQKKVLTMKKRLSRSAIYATISIFITNVAALWILEIPLAKIMGYQYPVIAMIVTILVPTILMAAFVLTISPPPKENLHKVVLETMKIVYEKHKKDTKKIKRPKKRSFVLNFVMNIIWLLSMTASLAIIVYGLKFASFPPLSYLIFIVFLSLIAFAGTKIRDEGKELHMITQKESFLNVLLDIFALPVIRLGKWFTNKWKRYNIISVFFSALIDLPFMSFIKFLEQWRNFLKEKKEDIY